MDETHHMRVIRHAVALHVDRKVLHLAWWDGRGATNRLVRRNFVEIAHLQHHTDDDVVGTVRRARLRDSRQGVAEHIPARDPAKVARNRGGESKGDATTDAGGSANQRGAVAQAIAIRIVLEAD